MNAILRWLKYAAPAPLPAALSSAAGGFMVLGALVSLGYGLSNEAGTFVENAGFLFGAIITPFIGLLLVAAALIEKQPLPRALIWAGAAGMWLFGGLGLLAGLAASPTTGPATAFVSYCCLCSPVALACLAPAVYFARRAAPGLRSQLAADQEHQILQIAAVRGETALADIANTLGLPPREVASALERLIHAQRFDGLLDAESGRVYTRTAVIEKQRALAGIVNARGQITLEELADELRAPRHLLRDWVYQLVRRGDFTGYVNWAEGVIYSAEAKKLTAAGRCPRCNGELALAGKGVIRCEHCGAEIFL
jgi:DNA-binding Lrp family transcriptional regulator